MTERRPRKETDSVMYYMPRLTKLQLQMFALRNKTTLSNLLNTAAKEYLRKLESQKEAMLIQ